MSKMVLPRSLRKPSTVTFTVDGHIVLLSPEDIGLAYFQWYLKGKGYLYRHLPKLGGERRMISLAREITGAREDEIVDHINGDTLDNRRSNLRICTMAENNMNTYSRVGASRFRGVSPYRGRWQARIPLRDGGRKWVGVYDREEDAARAWDEAARAEWGEHATYNFPRKGERSALIHIARFAPGGES